MNDPAQTGDSAACGRSVLIIDDDALNLKLFAMTLAGRGYRVLLAMDARRGLDLAGSERPDLIMMDIQLPDMSGLEATRLLKQDADTSGIPVLITTAFLVDSEALRQSGCNAYLPKPFSGPQLLSALDSLIAQSAG
jgi:two-component system, cell cycle response regulator DivK